MFVAIHITNTTRHGFTSHEMLDNLNLVHMNGRVYDPVIGRFMSADPLVPAMLGTQGFNRYAYVGNRPLTYVDPSGFSPVGEGGPDDLPPPLPPIDPCSSGGCGIPGDRGRNPGGGQYIPNCERKKRKCGRHVANPFQLFLQRIPSLGLQGFARERILFVSQNLADPNQLNLQLQVAGWGTGNEITATFAVPAGYRQMHRQPASARIWLVAL